MTTRDAIAHLDEAIRLLTLEAWRGSGADDMQPWPHACNIHVELDRVDCAIGPKGESMFGRLAQTALEVFIELKAARAALKEGKL